MIFKGSCVALVTPFKNNKVDFDALARLIDFQIDAKTDAILVLGTTGESSTLSDKEKMAIIKFAKNKIAGRAKLVVGTGSNSTKTAITNSQIAQKLGADAVLVVSPYYNKCTQAGAILHYKAVANSINIPVILYNVPSRTGFNLLPESVEKLAEVENIVAIKEANGDINHILELFDKCRGKIDIYSGNDNLNHIFYTLGGAGTISVVANIFPKQIKQQLETKNNATLHKISQLCFVEPNPIPIKFLLCYAGFIENELRLPLTPLSNAYKKMLKDCYNQIQPNETNCKNSLAEAIYGD